MNIVLLCTTFTTIIVSFFIYALDTKLIIVPIVRLRRLTNVYLWKLDCPWNTPEKMAQRID